MSVESLCSIVFHITNSRLLLAESTRSTLGLILGDFQKRPKLQTTEVHNRHHTGSSESYWAYINVVEA